ncbi:class I SAM-dependent methyltransferase [Chelatococcus asaccharovorans]|uniref:Methyltransferase family protein n=1 Tax=Chelatococcus asaccharovorans TaxID=28210 RepID=A0A2V3UIB6_9HYPH|nr:class I SAM-dependent methyltransferase [Chelatococcus asaccharovorans]MBS7705739.1 class I SAM-dependent methyltransferase [Chelatococcus asaccharovorans]PXW58758.1 methyltransferase family protein [Chelatococcus asaccharovorans]
MAERLSFTPGAMPYNAMLAAEHVARYILAQPLCGGKRVLDIACGEGYGTSFLKSSGAASVVGIDISGEAIASAKARFGQTGVTFAVGDALSAKAVRQFGPFDLITCFETIEHVADPGRLLGNLRNLMAPDGTIIVSCPNDSLEASRGIKNPYHQRTYTLKEFRETAEAVLGPATQWLLGTPLTGLTILDCDTDELRSADTAMDLALRPVPLERSFMLPAQKDQSVEPETSTFFVGLWNATVPTTQLVAPISRPSYLEYWLEVERLRKVNAAQNAEIEHLRTAAAAQNAEMEHLRAAEAARNAEIEGLKKVDAEQKAEIDYCRELARVSEERAREIRRIAAFEKDTLIAEVTKLRYFHDVAYQSRAHRAAAAYIRHASGDGFVARMLRLFRNIAASGRRTLRRLAR